jgi:DNA-binding NtrC family response regulator
MILVLIADRRITASELGRNLSEHGCIVTIAETSHEVLRLAKQEEPDIVIMSVVLPGGDGLDMLSRLRILYPLLDILMFVEETSVDAVVKSMKLGARDCLAKPVNTSKLLVAVHSAYESKGLRCKKILDTVQMEPPSQQLAGDSPQIREVKKLISLVGPSMAPVLILGETGTRKELVARAIHSASDRSSGPFITVNMSALPENILESELFGYKKGAFTSAESDKTGLLDIANKGTFLPTKWETRLFPYRHDCSGLQRQGVFASSGIPGREK